MFSQTACARRSKLVLVGVVPLLLLTCGVAFVAAQEAAPYFEAGYDPLFLKRDAETGTTSLDDRVVKSATLLKNQVLTGGLPFAGNSDKFKLYYTGYVFRGFTQISQLNKLPEKRKEIADDLRRAGVKSKEIHDALLADTEKYMKLFVSSTTRNWHPAVRFNAMLVIGDLNADEQGVQVQNVPSRFSNPLPTALDFLVTEYQKPTQLDSVKLAALIGILRHAQLDWTRPEANRIPAAKRQELTQLMLALVEAKDPPAGRTLEGHVWLQRRGIDILAALGLVGTNDRVNQAISAIIKNHDADLALRCTAAEALGKTLVKPTVKANLDPAKESLQLVSLLVEACHRELDRISEVQKKKLATSGMMQGGMEGMMPGGMGGMMPGGAMPGMEAGGGTMPGGMMPGAGMPGEAGGMGMMGGMMSATPKDPVVELFRRQLKYEIESVKRGVSGMGRLTNLKDVKVKKTYDDLVKEINDVSKATDPPTNTSNLSLETLKKSLQDSLKPLETKTATLLPKPKVVAPVEPVSDDPIDAPTAAPAAAAAGAAAAGPAVPRAPGAVGAGAVGAGIGAVGPAAGGAPAAGRAPPGNAAVGKAAPGNAGAGAAAPATR